MFSAVARAVSTRARAPGRETSGLAAATRLAPALCLVAIALVGGWLRLTGTNWDDGAHLHPDERYLTMVADQVDWPSSPAGYFDVQGSPLSPYNTEVGRAYLYGVFPLVATKAVAAAAGRDTYGDLNLVGRRLSALADIGSILLVSLIGSLLLAGRGKRAATAGALLAAALYALAVLAIQLAHFFTVESWLVFFTLLAFYLAALLARRRLQAPAPLRSYALPAALGSAVGLVAAAKVSGLLVALPVALALLLRPAGGLSLGTRVASLALSGLTVLFSAYVVFRLASPYAFEHSSWLDLRPSVELRAALEQQQRAIDGDFLFPPAYQWLLSTPVWDPLRNLVVWGLGLPLGLASIAGLGWMAVAAARRPRRPAPVLELMVLSFVALVFFYFGSRFTHSLRYLVPIVPFLCVTAAYGLVALSRTSVWVARVAAAVVLAGTLLYALAFVQVYRHPNTRVAATRWIESNVPPGATIVNEHWDDGLPVGGGSGQYRLGELLVFDPDDDAKLQKLYEGLARADYYALSSPRAWNTIGRLPDRFPIMARFYDRLFAGQLGFRRAAEFTSHPRLLGVELDDLDAEEAFWVYDHPRVVILRRTEPLTRAGFTHALCGATATLPGCP